jgi:hypothetical protein
MFILHASFHGPFIAAQAGKRRFHYSGPIAYQIGLQLLIMPISIMSLSPHSQALVVARVLKEVLSIKFG